LAVVDGRSPTVSILAGEADGAFGKPIPVAVTSRPLVIRAGPIDRDGRIGLYVAGEDGISLLTSSGAGAFRSIPIGVPSSATDLAVADCNDDGYPDVVAIEERERRVTLLYGSSDGTFRAGPQFSTLRGPRHVHTADSNG